MSGRSDDNIKTVENRLRIYRERTAPILNYYQDQKKLKNINGSQTIKKIAKEIKKIIKESGLTKKKNTKK